MLVALVPSQAHWCGSAKVRQLVSLVARSQRTWTHWLLAVPGRRTTQPVASSVARVWGQTSYSTCTVAPPVELYSTLVARTVPGNSTVLLPVTLLKYTVGTVPVPPAVLAKNILASCDHRHRDEDDFLGQRVELDHDFGAGPPVHSDPVRDQALGHALVKEGFGLLNLREVVAVPGIALVAVLLRHDPKTAAACRCVAFAKLRQASLNLHRALAALEDRQFEDVLNHRLGLLQRIQTTVRASARPGCDRQSRSQPRHAH